MAFIEPEEPEEPEPPPPVAVTVTAPVAWLTDIPVPAIIEETPEAPPPATAGYTVPSESFKYKRPASVGSEKIATDPEAGFDILPEAVDCWFIWDTLFVLF